jgi:hypothetical protein
MEQKYREQINSKRGTIKERTRLVQRNKSNLNVEQNYRDHGTKKRKKANAKEQIEY